MTFIGLYAPASAWLLSLLVPLVVFYFLKLKRPRVRVPSLVLWRRVIEDKRVNSPFQKFKRNILLLLQLLVLVLLVMAAMQPFFRGRHGRRRRLPVLIDCSASMAALDKRGGRSRLDVATERVDELIDGLLPDQELCLISFADTARKRTGFTNNTRILREALGQLRVEDVPSNTEDALRMTQALARTFSFDEVLLISDGNFPERADFELSFELNYQRLPSAGANIGITSANARRGADSAWQVFVLVEGSADAKGMATVELREGADTIGKERLTMGEGTSEQVVFRVDLDRPASLTVRLVPDEFDALAADNVAFLDLPVPRPLWVYVSGTLGVCRHAFASLDGVRVFPGSDGGESDSGYDMVITDDPVDLAKAADLVVCSGFVPEELRSLVTLETGSADVVDWRRSSSLLRHVELGDVLILDVPRAAAGSQDQDFENAGYTVLAHGRRGPLMLSKREGMRQTFAILFHLTKSTLPYRIGFPVMMANLAEIARQQAGLSEVRAHRTGVLPELAVVGGAECDVIGPGGESYTQRGTPNGVLRGVPASESGEYTVKAAGAVHRVGVSLLSAEETGLAGIEEIKFNEALAVSASVEAMKTEKPLWPVLAWLAFFGLLTEWWYYQRRSGG